MICYSNDLRIYFILIGSLAGICNGAIAMNSYQQMPPLYAVDDYQECLQQHSVYCMVYVEIQPDNSSMLWQQIEDFHRSYEMHYRHDLLYRGVCRAECKNYSSPTDKSWPRSSMMPKSDNVQWFNILYEISQSQNSILEYQQESHECVANEIYAKYNLSVKTFLTYCDNPKEPLETGHGYHNAIIVLIVIALLNVFASIYDIFLKCHRNGVQSNASYYDRNHGNQVHKYLTAFSMYRNYRRLVVPNNSAIGQDFSFIDGFRTLLSMIIAAEHVYLGHFMHVQNTQFVEDIFQTQFFRMLMQVYTVIELFFLLSGLMLFVKMSKSDCITTKSGFKESLTFYMRMAISRYLRYIPSVLLVMLFSSQILLHLHKAPFWRHIIEPNVVQCHRKSWLNIFMMSNVKANNACWPHTWYIAADFQLYAFFLAVLIFVAKYPQTKKVVYTVLGILGLLLPSIIIFWKDFDPIPTLYAETFRHQYYKDTEMPEHIYLSSYSNLNGFFVGIICGELYMNYLRHDRYRNLVGRYLKYTPLLGWSVILATYYLGSVLQFQEHSVWTYLFAVLNKGFMVVIVATVVVLLKMCRRGGFLTWPIFRLLGRISYQVYLWHYIVLFIFWATFEQPFNVSIFSTIAVQVGSYMFVAALALLITIMVEYPCAELFQWLDIKKNTKQKN